MADAFQHTFRAEGDALVAFIAHAAGQATSGFFAALKTHVDLVKGRAPFYGGQGLALGSRLSLEQVHLHGVGPNYFIPEDIHFSVCIGMLCDLDVFTAKYIVNVHGRTATATDGAGDGTLPRGEIPNREYGCLKQSEQLCALSDLGSFGEDGQIG
jgi:hypothetical protein